MKNKTIRSLALGIIFFLTLSLSYLPAEKISFQVNYCFPSFPVNDLDQWLTSYNQLWQDWAASKKGSLNGQFPTLQYSPSLEMGLRIAILPGFSLAFSGSHFSSQAEGQVQFLKTENNQTETHFLRNQVSFLPLKIGFNYRQALPFFQPLAVNISLGRHIIFISYKKYEEYEARFDVLGKEFLYWFNKDCSYRSESLGYFAELGLEYSPFRFFSIFASLEQIWNSTDGFKGTLNYSDYTGENRTDKASLYFYESKPGNLSQYYRFLQGAKKRPSGENIRDVRQAIFNFGGFSFKIGLRFNF
ncbi:MAG: hypothetical protein DRJ11_00920 [Candidatus Aminicenantes bacterium]|nr:MAG: hypothetical protein DRJ11_00920 [Candidatus Aminicenantes bacterium]